MGVVFGSPGVRETREGPLRPWHSPSASAAPPAGGRETRSAPRGRRAPCSCRTRAWGASYSASVERQNAPSRGDPRVRESRSWKSCSAAGSRGQGLHERSGLFTDTGIQNMTATESAAVGLPRLRNCPEAPTRHDNHKTNPLPIPTEGRHQRRCCCDRSCLCDMGDRYVPCRLRRSSGRTALKRESLASRLAISGDRPGTPALCPLCS